MYGFNIIQTPDNLSKVQTVNDNQIVYNNIVCNNKMIPKFNDDKIFSETDEHIIILDGVITNKKEIINETKLAFKDAIAYLYGKYGEHFFNVFRGSFAGAFFDKKSNKWIVFSDQIGSKFLFYYHQNEFFVCSSVMGDMYNILRNLNINYSLSTENALLLLTYGFMLEDRTLSNEIKKIEPGCYLVYENNSVKIKQFFEIKNDCNNSLNERDSIELIDFHFRQAIKRQFEKDLEYEYKHLVALSAGLDSRMTSWVAHEMGYHDQLNFTYSQSNYLDETVPKKISSDLMHEWIFKALDNGLWLYDNIDQITEISGGNVAYSGLAHTNSLLKYLNFNEVGLIHSGQLGDVIIGASYSNVKGKSKGFVFGDGAYSKKHLDLIDFKPNRVYADKETTMLYYRGFSGINYGLQLTYKFTESLSPFLDIDFINEVLSVPLKFRQNHRVYRKWIMKKYPGAAKYVWEHIGGKITEPIITIFGRKMTFRKFMSIIMVKATLKGHNINTPKHMNPLGYYYSTNPDLSIFFDDYFNKHIDLVDDNLLKSIVTDIKNRGTVTEKIQATSLLSALKIFYDK